MSEEIKDVNELEADTISTPSVEETQQEPIVEEDVKPIGSDVQENLKRALHAERERRKEAESRKQELERELENKQTQTVDNDDDAYRRFVKLEAETKINSKILSDSTFKDRIDLVRDTMEKTGFDVEVADSIVKSQLYDQLITESKSQQPKEPVPNQIKTQAIPEPNQAKKTGNLLDDVESGAIAIDPSLRATILKYRKKG